MKVSVLVPVYAVQRYIERCARSLFEQTYPDIEYIFVDDASPDDSIAILKKVSEDYPARKARVRIIRNANNRGLSAARNILIAHCTGDFVSFVDSDDYLETNAIEQLVLLQQATNADIVSGNAYKHTDSGTLLLCEPDYSNKEEMLRNLASQMMHHNIWGRLIKRSLFIDHQIGAEEGTNVGEDWQMLVPLVYYASGIAKLDRPVYHYNCTNSGSYMTRKETDAHFLASLKQDLRTLEIITAFLENKDEELFQSIKLTSVGFAHGMMDHCARSKNSATFVLLKDFLNKDISLYGRDSLTRFFDNHFYLYRLRLSLRTAYYSLRQSPH